jgi:WhiB family transcriptional regulator, redox-sensing transcriptional regulator
MTSVRAQWSPGAAGPLLAREEREEGSWRDSASCAGADSEAFFPPKGGSNGMARRVCLSCPVRLQCLDDALDYERGMGRETRHGIFGGLTPDERWNADRASRRLVA